MQNILIWAAALTADSTETKPPALGRRRFAINIDLDSSGYAANFK
jgi:hypothetical protein